MKNIVDDIGEEFLVTSRPIYEKYENVITFKSDQAIW